MINQERFARKTSKNQQIIFSCPNDDVAYKKHRPQTTNLLEFQFLDFLQQDKLEEHSLRESATAKEVIDTL